VITLDGVAKRYGDKVALAPTTLTVPERRRLALIGPSGCGKSTLVRLVLGLLEPDAGRVIVEGLTVGPTTVVGIRRRIGYVVQDGGLFPHLTGDGNVALLAEHLGWGRERVKSRVADLAALVRLEPVLLGRYPSEMSGGQRQRVGIMRALMLDPPILLLDEPMGSLDPLVRSRLQKDLGRIFTELGKTVLLITHDLGEAALLAEEIVLMRAGAVVQRGTMRDLVDTPADSFVREFVDAQRFTWH
jgi:osmoprotectant transport system ATP-binding protein